MLRVVLEDWFCVEVQSSQHQVVVEVILVSDDLVEQRSRQQHVGEDYKNQNGTTCSVLVLLFRSGSRSPLRHDVDESENVHGDTTAGPFVPVDIFCTVTSTAYLLT